MTALRSVLLLLALGLLPGLVVPAVAEAQDLRLAFIDTRRAVANSKEGKAAEKTLTGLMEKKRDELRPFEEQLKRMQEEYETQRFVLSKEALQERELDLLKRRRDLERDMTAAQEEIEIEERKAMQPILKRIQDVLRDVGKEKGYAMILEKSSPGVLFYEESLDITDLVIQRLNERG